MVRIISAADETIPEAVRLKNEGQAVVNFNILRSVVSRPTQSNIFTAPSFNALGSIAGLVTNATCNGLFFIVHFG